MNLENAWINGRSLGAAVKANGGVSRFEVFSPTGRVRLDLKQDAYLLGVERQRPSPFVVDGNLLLTAHDLDLSASPVRLNPATPVLGLANLRFSRSALESAMHDFVQDDGSNETLRVERLGSSLDLTDWAAAFRFSREVCAWGRGARVWGNLMRFHGEEHLGHLVSEWLRAAEAANDPGTAISGGTQVKGLGVSFASKHLRLFQPQRFATLDEVISTGLGYALNCAGYALWLHDLRRLMDEHGLDYRIADIESAIFVLVRQLVRGREGFHE